MAGARHGVCELTRHGMETAWARHGVCELALKLGAVIKGAECNVGMHSGFLVTLCFKTLVQECGVLQI
jgi:hypothetical protein